MRTNSIKRLLIILIISTMVFLPSCVTEKSVIHIGDTPIDNEVFTYYLNAAIDEMGGKTASELIVDAAERVRYYVKVNTLAAKQGIILSQTEKMEISEKLSGIDAVYGEYYKKIGVSKQAVQKIMESNAYEMALLNAYFGEKGIKAVKNEEVLKTLNKYFIAFKSVNGYFTKTKENGEITEISAAEKELLISEFKDAAKQINDKSQTIEEAGTKLQKENANNTVEITTLKKGSSYYPESFFNQVEKAKANEAIVVVTDKNVFLVIKEAIKINGDYFNEHYMYALLKLKGKELRNLISSDSTYEANVLENKAADIYNSIIKARKG